MNRPRLVGIAVSPAPAMFAPLLYSGRLGQAVSVVGDLGLSCIELMFATRLRFRRQKVQALVSSAGLAVSAGARLVRLASWTGFVSPPPRT